MRLLAFARNPEDEVKRVILCETSDGVYLFLSRSMEDKGSFADEWYECTKDAQAACRSRFGIELEAWQEVPDPMPGCQHDWIKPVRVKGRDRGQPEWGVFEQLVDGHWVPVFDLSV
ncbi:hypothetical protein [Microvirga guangxiensis]|uniref:hypothetical protein n=1 Tax=Microvirga guangxiensis TaxID=549386 RepID=UPI00111365C3|nr:hypothetical protein [Microvirga guangxiensis]